MITLLLIEKDHSDREHCIQAMEMHKGHCEQGSYNKGHMVQNHIYRDGSGTLGSGQFLSENVVIRDVKILHRRFRTLPCDTVHLYYSNTMSPKNS